MELVRQSERPVVLFSRVDTTAFTIILVMVVFTIWIIQSVSYNPHHGTWVDLPNVIRPVWMPGAIRQDSILISVTRDGRAYLGSEQINPVNLPSKIHDLLLGDRDVEHKAYIAVDMRVRWSSVEPVLDGVRSAGIVRVGFLVDQRRAPVLKP